MLISRSKAASIKSTTRQFKGVCKSLVYANLYVFIYLFGLFNLHLGAGVGNLDIELGGAIEDDDAVARGDTFGDFGAIGAVLHHEHVQFVDVVHQELEVSIGEHVARLFVGAVPNVGHADFAAPFAAHTRINTFRAAP